jgi:hypothetical protein
MIFVKVVLVIGGNIFSTGTPELACFTPNFKHSWTNLMRKGLWTKLIGRFAFPKRAAKAEYRP